MFIMEATPYLQAAAKIVRIIKERLHQVNSLAGYKSRMAEVCAFTVNTNTDCCN